MAETPLPTPPATLEGFRIGARIATSGVLAVHTGLSKLDLPVEAYIVRADALTGGFEADDFIDNVRLAAAVHHEGLLPFVTGGREGGLVFAIAKSVEGRPLDAILAKDGPLPEAAALVLAKSVAGALEALERAGLRHGDIAPQRVLQVGVSAWLLRPPRILPAALSPRNERYQSPEEVRGAGSGIASDLFVLGLILVEAMTGAHPLAAVPSVHRALRDWKAPDLTTTLRAASPEMRAVVAKLLAPEPAKRYATAADALRAITEAASERPETAPIDIAPMPTTPTLRPLTESPQRTPGRLYVKARLGEAMLELDDDEVFAGPASNENVRAQPTAFAEASIRVERTPAADVVHAVTGEMKVNGRAAASQPLADGDRVEATGISARYERSARAALRSAHAAAVADAPPPSNPVAGVVTAFAVLGTLAAVGWGFVRISSEMQTSKAATTMANRATQLLNDDTQRLPPPPVAPTPPAPAQSERDARKAYDEAVVWARRHPNDKPSARTKFYEVFQRFSETAYGMLARLDAFELDRAIRPPADRAFEDLLRAVDGVNAAPDEDTVLRLRSYVEDHPGTLAGERAHAALVKSQAVQRGRFDADMAAIRAAEAKKDWREALDIIDKIMPSLPASLRDEVLGEKQKIQDSMNETLRESPGGQPAPHGGGDGKPPEGVPPKKDEAADKNRKAEELYHEARKFMESGKESEALGAFLTFLREYKDTVNGARYDIDVRRSVSTLVQGPAGVIKLFRGKVEKVDKTRWRISYDFEDAKQLEDFRDLAAFDQPPRATWKVEGGSVKCSRGAGALLLDAPFAADQVSASVVVNPERAHDIGVIFVDPSEQKRFYLFMLQNTFFGLGKGPDVKPFLENAIVLFGPDMWRDTPPGQLGFVRKCGSDEPQIRPNEPLPVKCGKTEGEVWMHFEGNHQLRGSAYGDKKYEFPAVFPGLFVLNSAGLFDDFVVEGTPDPKWVEARWRAILSGL